MAWAPPEVQTDEWSPPEAAAWSPPEAVAEPDAPSSGGFEDFANRTVAGVARNVASTVAGLARMPVEVPPAVAAIAKAIPLASMAFKSAGEKSALNEIAKFAEDVAARSASDYGVDPTRDDTVAAKLAEGAAGLVVAAPAVLAGGAGLPLLAAQALGGTKEADYQKAIEEGKTEAEAEAASSKSALIKTGATLPLYAVGGKLGEMAGAKVATVIPSVAAKIASQFGLNATANVLSSGAARGVEAAIEGKPIVEAISDVTIPGMVQDISFSAYQTLNTAMKKAVDTDLAKLITEDPVKSAAETTLPPKLPLPGDAEPPPIPAEAVDTSAKPVDEASIRGNEPETKPAAEVPATETVPETKPSTPTIKPDGARVPEPTVERAGEQASVAPAAETLPKLRQGEKQGDLLVTQTEDLKLVGEKGVDTLKLAEEKAAAEKATKAAKAKQDKEQLDIFNKPPADPEVIQRQISNLEYRIAQDRKRSIKNPEDAARLAELKSNLAEQAARAEAEHRAEALADHHEQVGAQQYELLDSLKALGGLPAVSVKGKSYAEHLKRIKESAPAAALNLFRKKQSKSLDGLREALNERGFDFATEYDMLAALERRLVTKQPHYGSKSAEVLFSPGKRGGGTPVPASMTGTGKTSIPDVLSSYERVIESLGGNTPIRFGRFLQRALGVYKVKPEVARIRDAGDIGTAAHEIAHGIQHQVFGDTNSTVLLRSLPRPDYKELVALGKALYGPRIPSNGYGSEGFAELVRLHLTTDTAAAAAPNAHAFFETQILGKNEALARSVAAAKQQTDIWRGQGAFNRALAQMPEGAGRIAQLADKTKTLLAKDNWIEEFSALKELADEHQKQTGRKLSPFSNPYELASAKRGTSGAVTLQMVQHGMVDPFGNLAKDASGRLIGSLQEAAKPARGLEAQLSAYLWARRALQLWERGMNPGMTKADAEFLVPALERAHPQLPIVAHKIYAWQDGVLDYIVAANPALAADVARIRAVSQDYVPLGRVMESREAKTTAAMLASNPLRNIRGSGRQVKPIFDQIIANTQRLVAQANRSMVLDSIVKMSDTPGFGHLVEEVPLDRVRKSVVFDKVRKQLEDLGIDTSAANGDEVLSFFSQAVQPKGADPIIAVKRGDATKWYQVDPKVYDILQGMDQQRMNLLADIFLAAPARGFRMGTTGLRASFSLVTNPLRDFQTLLVNSAGSNNPARLVAGYIGALKDAAMSAVSGKKSPARELFDRLGVEGAQPLGIDINYTKKTAKNLFRGGVAKVVHSPIEFLREALSFTEKVPRVTEMQIVAKKLGWVPGTPLTPDMAVELANAGKRITVDFSAGGRMAKIANQAIPFFNATIQGSRTTGRVAKRDPKMFALKVGAYAVAPTLALWWKNKDEEWYQNLPWRERYLYTNFSPDGKNVIQIPKTQEYGGFAAVVEGLADSWYQQDPEGATEALGHVFETVNPVDLPVLGKTAKEQWKNRIDFFDRPIVPRSQIDLPPGEQSSPYTTEISKTLGRAFPDTLSPRRIDAAVRSVFGGVGTDLTQASDAVMHKLGIKSEKQDREFELSDVAVAGRLFRRGGVSSSASLPIADFYDEWKRYSTRARSKARPLSDEERTYWEALDDAHDVIKPLQQIADKTADVKSRQYLYTDISRRSREVLKSKPQRFTAP